MVLVGLNEKAKTTVTLFAFLQGNDRLACFQCMRQRIDRRQSFAPFHFEFAAILPGRGEIRINSVARLIC